jgi:hypothetical protein
MEQLFEYRGKIEVQHPYVYEWTLRVRPDTAWTFGNAPLEVFAQLNTNDSEDAVIDFDVVDAFIVPEDPTNVHPLQRGENCSSEISPMLSLQGFEGSLVFMIIGALIVLLGVTHYRYKKT